MFLPAADADIPTIVALMNRAYRGARDAGWSNETAYLSGDRTTEAYLREDLAASPAATLLKWVEGDDPTARGCVWLEPLGNGGWYLGSLCVDPARQNAGQGRTLLAAAEAWARAHGAARVRMTVINVRESLIAWYLRRGYAPTGETAPFPYGNERFGTPLRDDLAFVVLEKELAAG
jgi:ribosomal protein S18 acetylase RimI-like enzyme